MLGLLAELYRKQGQYAKVAPLYKRALAINEQIHGKDHPEVARVLEHYASVLRELGKNKKAEALEKRAKTIRSH